MDYSQQVIFGLKWNVCPSTYILTEAREPQRYGPIPEKLALTNKAGIMPPEALREGVLQRSSKQSLTE
jgi:hypothetical protein